jgi:hypothetical protein
MNNVTSLALLYGWALLAAGMFALGERACRGLFGQRQPTPGRPQEPANR